MLAETNLEQNEAQKQNEDICANLSFPMSARFLFLATLLVMGAGVGRAVAMSLCRLAGLLRGEVGRSTGQ